MGGLSTKNNKAITHVLGINGFPTTLLINTSHKLEWHQLDPVLILAGFVVGYYNGWIYTPATIPLISHYPPKNITILLLSTI
jgi:hypothetical protein